MMGVREIDWSLEQWQMGVKDLRRRMVLAPTPRERERWYAITWRDRSPAGSGTRPWRPANPSRLGAVPWTPPPLMPCQGRRQGVPLRRREIVPLVR